MNTWYKSLALTAFILIAIALLMGVDKAPPKPLAGPVLMITTAAAEGSAVSIGDGYILTAAHVVEDPTGLKVKTDAGEIIAAEILWANDAYDIALLRADNYAGFASSNISCRTPAVGEDIRAEGHPGPLEFISVWGKVAGAVRERARWREVVVTNIVAVSGQSGGPVYDTTGNVVAITVGALIFPSGLGGASFSGIGYAVPGSAICGLMARV